MAAGSSAPDAAHKVLPPHARKTPHPARRGRPGRTGGAWSVFEDHTALVRDGPASTPADPRRAEDPRRRHAAGRGQVERGRAEPHARAPPTLRCLRSRPLPRLRGLRRSLPEGDAGWVSGSIADLAPDAPRWATAGGRGYAETANLAIRPAEFGKFAGAVARRYSGGYRGLPTRRLVLGLERAQPQPLHEAARAGTRALPRDGTGRGARDQGGAAGSRVLIGETAPAGRPAVARAARVHAALPLPRHRLAGPQQRRLRRVRASRGRRLGPPPLRPRRRRSGRPRHRQHAGDPAPRLYLDRAAAAGRLPARSAHLRHRVRPAVRPARPDRHDLPREAGGAARTRRRSSRIATRAFAATAQYLLYDDPLRPGPGASLGRASRPACVSDRARPKPSGLAYRLPLVVTTPGAACGSGAACARAQAGGRCSCSPSVEGWRDAGRALGRTPTAFSRSNT